MEPEERFPNQKNSMNTQDLEENIPFTLSLMERREGEDAGFGNKPDGSVVVKSLFR